MAVTSVDLVHLVESADLPYNEATYVLKYLIKVDDKDTTFATVRDDASVPAYGDQPPAATGVTGVYCTNRSFRLVNPNHRLLWEAEITYESSVYPGVIDGTDTTIVSWGSKPIREVINYDQDGYPIQNAAGDPFNPGVESDVHLLTCQIEREETDVLDPGGNHIVKKYVNSVNQSAITIAGLTIEPETALMESITAVYDPADLKWDFVYNIVIKENDDDWTPYVTKINGQRGLQPRPNYPEGEKNAWLVPVLNAGFQFYKDATVNPPDKVIAKDADGNQLTIPVKLNADGERLDDADEPIWLGFRDRKVEEWSALGLPSVFPTP